MKAIFRYIAAAAALFPSAALACNPSALLEGGGGSVNYLSTVGPGSNCFFSSGLLDSTGAAAFPAVAALGDATANPTDALLGSLNFLYNGTTWDRWRSVGTGIAKTDMSTVAGTAVTTGTGASSAGTPRVVLATDSTLAANQSTNEAQINGVAPSMGNGVSGTGVQRVTIASDSTGQVTLASGAAVNSTTILPTSGGASTCYLLSTAANNATNCKASAGQVYEVRAVNTTAVIYYLRMYNLASAPTCSSATGFIETIPVGANASSLGGGFMAEQSFGQAYSTGIGFCLTGGGSSTDNTSAAAGVYITILYK